MKRLMIAAAFAAITMSALALPSIDAVQAQLAQGHAAQAETMVREVISAKPDSARARYVLAEILAHGGRFAQAAEEAAQARRLDPSLSFTQPEKFKAFSALLDRELAANRPAGGMLQTRQAPVWQPAPVVPAVPAGGVPAWAWAAGAGVLAWGAWRWTGSRQAGPGAAAAGATMAPAPAAPSDGPGSAHAGGSTTGFAAAPQAGAPYGMPAPAARPGNGLLGTGLAVAGGVAAGMLAERLMDSHREPALGTWAGMAPLGLTPNAFDAAPPLDSAAQALEDRPIDMGTGDGWGGGDPDSSTASDSDGW